MENDFAHRGIGAERRATESLFKLLTERGYPSDRIAMEPALRNGCRADFVVYAKSAPLPLAIIELKIGDELANKDCVADQLHAYSERMGASVEVFLALFSKEGKGFRFFQFNRSDKSFRETDLPSYDPLNMATNAALFNGGVTAKKHASIQLKVISWGIIPAVVLSCIVLDALQIYSLSFERLALIGILFVSLLVPSVKEVKIGEYVLSLFDKYEK